MKASKSSNKETNKEKHISQKDYKNRPINLILVLKRNKTGIKEGF